MRLRQTRPWRPRDLDSSIDGWQDDDSQLGRPRAENRHSQSHPARPWRHPPGVRPCVTGSAKLPTRMSLQGTRLLVLPPRRCRYLHHPLRLLPAGAENRAFPRRTRKMLSSGHDPGEWRCRRLGYDVVPSCKRPHRAHHQNASNHQHQRPAKPHPLALPPSLPRRHQLFRLDPGPQKQNPGHNGALRR